MTEKSPLRSIQVASVGTRELFRLAEQARERAYAPYSQFKVGAAVRLVTGESFGGCNVENSAYGSTICAERGAILKAVSETGRIQIAEVLVLAGTEDPSPPCGSCRQVISEFSDPGIQIHLCNPRGELRTLTLEELLPFAFTPRYLK